MKLHRALRPYIRCFWGTLHPVTEHGAARSAAITPDTCADVIFTVDHTANCVHTVFCGIDDAPSAATESFIQERTKSQFGIRFYPWAVPAFAEGSMVGTKSAWLPAESRFSDLVRFLLPQLFEKTTLSERIALAEPYLLAHFHPERLDPLALNASHALLKARGGLKTREMARNLHVSERHLERSLLAQTGLLPKLLATLFRYQFLWNDALEGRYSSLSETAYALGYADQAHMAREFRRFHGLTLSEALRNAGKDVGFFQDLPVCDMIE